MARQTWARDREDHNLGQDMNFLVGLLQTFHSRAFYASLVRHGRGIGCRFMLVNVAFDLIVLLIALTPMLPQAPMKIDEFCARLPAITLQDAKLSMDHASPYSVSLGADGKAQILFDTTDRNIDMAEINKAMSEQHVFLFVARDFVAFSKRGSVEIHTFSTDPRLAKKNVSVSQADWHSYGKRLLYIGIPFFLVSFILIDFLVALFLTFIGAIAVKIAALLCTYKPNFAGAMRLAAAAYIPLAIVSFALRLFSSIAFKAPLQLPFLIGFAIWGAFAIFGLVSVNRPFPTTPNEPSQ